MAFNDSRGVSQDGPWEKPDIIQFPDVEQRTGPQIKQETGEKRVSSTGATRQHAAGKGLPTLLPPDGLLELAKHFENGAVLHGARNWEKGLNLSWFLDSLYRHLWAELMGETDEDHARALAWNAVCYLATKKRIEAGTLPAELNDMPFRGKDNGSTKRIPQS